MIKKTITSGDILRVFKQDPFSPPLRIWTLSVLFGLLSLPFIVSGVQSTLSMARGLDPRDELLIDYVDAPPTLDDLSQCTSDACTVSAVHGRITFGASFLLPPIVRMSPDNGLGFFIQDSSIAERDLYSEPLTPSEAQVGKIGLKKIFTATAPQNPDSFTDIEEHPLVDTPGFLLMLERRGGARLDLNGLMEWGDFIEQTRIDRSFGFTALEYQPVPSEWILSGLAQQFDGLAKSTRVTLTLPAAPVSPSSVQMYRSMDLEGRVESVGAAHDGLATISVVINRQDLIRALPTIRRYRSTTRSGKEIWLPVSLKFPHLQEPAASLAKSLKLPSSAVRPNPALGRDRGVVWTEMQGHALPIDVRVHARAADDGGREMVFLSEVVHRNQLSVPPTHLSQFSTYALRRLRALPQRAWLSPMQPFVVDAPSTLSAGSPIRLKLISKDRHE